MCDDATIVAVQRVIAESSYLDGMPAIHQFSRRHATVDCNALLDLPDDSEFVDAAFRQMHGREVTDRRHRRWVRRLRIVSRSFVLICLRFSEFGTAHGTRIPGLWYALLLDQPRRGVLRIPFANAVLDRLRRKVVALKVQAVLK